MAGAAWIAYLCALGGLAVYGAHRLFLTALYLRHARAEPRPPAPERAQELPRVTVQLPLYNERYVAGRLLDAVTALDWPRDRLEVQVLDDSTDDTARVCAEKVAAMRAGGIDAHHLRRDDRRGFKAGALERGRRVARGDLLLVLDADFVPRADLLRKTVPYFGDPAVGMVQVRWEHINRESSALTRAQALLLDGHFVVEQGARSRSGRFFNFNGTAGVWRAAAIEEAGGWHADTLTEDLDLSYRALLAGWEFRYLASESAPAELPVDMNGFKGQQYRWAKGSIQVARKLLPRVLRADLPRRIKVEAFFHLTQNLPYLLTLVLLVLAVPVVVLGGAGPWQLHAATAAMTGVTLASYVTVSARAVGLPWWRALARLPVLVAITAGISVSQARAVVEGALGHESPFVRTPKHGVVGRGRTLWRGLAYRGDRSLAPVAEVALAVCFAGAVVAVVAAGAGLETLPFLLLFGGGFGYVGVRSMTR